MKPLGLLDVRPDPVSHKNLNAMLMRTFDKVDPHTDWVGVGRRNTTSARKKTAGGVMTTATSRRRAANVKATLQAQRSALETKISRGRAKVSFSSLGRRVHPSFALLLFWPLVALFRICLRLLTAGAAYYFPGWSVRLRRFQLL
jgi:hypothetical protein